MNQWIKIRLGFVYICFVGFFILIGLRLFQLQLWKDSGLEKLAQRQYLKVNKKIQYRQPILDRNGEELAVSMPSVSVFAHPKMIRARRKTAISLAKVLGGSPKKWLQRLDKTKNFVWIHRQLTEELASKLTALKLEGIFVEPENHRFYPNSTLAAQTIGFTDIDGNGIAGLEFSLDKQLIDARNRMAILRDGKGNLSYLEKKYGESFDTKDGVRVTIDRRVQHVVDEELEQAEQQYGGKNIMAVVIDPRTAEIIAIGQRPLIDPNQPNQFPISHSTNLWTSHLYEPGSTLKPIFVAEAIELGLLNPETKIDCEMGQLRIGNMTIHEAEDNHRFGHISVSEIIQHSSNSGAAKIALMLGPKRMKSAIQKFNLAKKTEISLPGEAYSSLKGDEVWKSFYQATVGFGQGISVTPLQMVMSYLPFANDGYWIRPKILLNEIEISAGNDSNKNRVLNLSTVKAMRKILVSVTEAQKATGIKARIEGIHVAGKTGTAQKYEMGKGYDSKKYLSSFIGFLPAERPELLIGVMIDEPRAPYYGGLNAAPVFKRIAERSLQILDRVPKTAVVKNFVEAPKSKELPPLIPMPEIRVASDGIWYMPNLKGLSMREALRILGEHVSSVKMAGEGFVDRQSPESGAIISPKTDVSLHFSPNS
ncbi:MAG: PASTA domain-containing protein [Deltaproteobacteria bacterium]|nr:PASTA domain-containing protein [Deltaproteobacteria bacterium]